MRLHICGVEEGWKGGGKGRGILTTEELRISLVSSGPFNLSLTSFSRRCARISGRPDRYEVRAAFVRARVSAMIVVDILISYLLKYCSSDVEIRFWESVKICQLDLLDAEARQTKVWRPEAMGTIAET